MKKYFNIISCIAIFAVVLFANISFAISDEDVAYVLSELKYFKASSEDSMNSLNKEWVSFTVDNELITKLAKEDIYFVLMNDPEYGATILGVQKGKIETSDMEPIYAYKKDDYGELNIGFKSVANLSNGTQTGSGFYVEIGNEVGTILLPSESANYAFTTIESTTIDEFKIKIKNQISDNVTVFKPSEISTALDKVREQIQNYSNDETSEIEALRTNNAFEQVATEFFLTIGDYAQDYLSQTFREDITIDRIVYNRVVMLNANFFDKSVNPAVSTASKIVKEFINKWFEFFSKLALVVIMIFVVVAGIKIILGTPNGKAKAGEILKKIVMAVVLIYFFPYVMRYAFDINAAITEKIYKETHVVEKAGAVAISQVSDLVLDELEFRSPQYVSNKSLKVGAGSIEATQLYLNKVEQYAASADLMRLMRAFAGVTLRMLYVIIWYILLVQTYIMVIIYIKRYITIAFLLAVYPLVIIGYLSGSMFGSSHTAFNHWCSKFFTNVFLQSIHAIIYGVITGILVEQVRESINGNPLKGINWILMIVATSFLFSAEKIITKLWHASIDTSERDGIKKFFGTPKQLWKNLTGG